MASSVDLIMFFLDSYNRRAQGEVRRLLDTEPEAEADADVRGENI